MRRPWSVLGVAAVLAVALSGCVGIPSSGGVSDGEIIDDQAVPEFVALPSSPRPGSSQVELLEDFMQAVRAPQGGYAVAKQYLTTDLARTWRPFAGALVRNGVVPQIETTTENVLAYTVSVDATVNDLGQYQEEPAATAQTLTFGFTQEDGEWRISAADDGIVLSQASFNDSFREQALYFFDPSYAYLVPDVRWFPSIQTSSSRLVTALLAGPAEWLQQGVVATAFPTATTLGDDRVQAVTGGVVVDLSAEATDTSTQVRDRMRQQLIATLDTPNVQLTVGGLPLSVPATTSDRAVRDPAVDSAALVGSGTEFGFDAGSGVAPIEGLSALVVDAGTAAATLSSDKQSVALLGADGIVRVAEVGDASPTVIDSRPGLVAASIDPFRFVWSAQSANAASLTAFTTAGDEVALQTGLPSDSRVVSLDVSRDGARLLLLLSTPVGPQLSVYGIVRQDLVPIGLAGSLDLPIGSGSPVDATWADDRTVAVMQTTDGTSQVTAYELGGPSSPLGSVADARSIAGGNGGTDGLRVILSSGEVWRPRGTGGWVATDIIASYLATKQ